MNSNSRDGAFGPQSHLGLPAVALFSLLHVTIAAFLTPVEHLDLRHVVQTHAHAFLQTGSQVLFTARTEDGGERVPTKDRAQ